MLLIYIGTSENSDDEQEHESEKWMHLVDRGGLVAIDNITYDFLVEVELELRRHFTIANATDQSLKELALQGIIQNENVLFYWELISINWESTEASELMKLMIQHYITIRGFSFASAFIEKYKQSSNKTTQKSKGLRKRLGVSTNSKVCDEKD